MITVDQLLLTVVNQSADKVKDLLANRDWKILLSLSKIISGATYITENQSRLLLKILSEYKTVFSEIVSDTQLVLEAPSWERPFRPIDKTKKLYTTATPDGNSVIVIEFAFSAAIRKVVANLSKAVDNLIQVTNGKLYQADLTERNIVTLIDELSKHHFEIDENLENFYKTIKSWNEDEVRSQFFITNITHSNFQKQITADLGMETSIDQNIINDRSMRYQYFQENPKNFGENLTEKIANRCSTKIWINRNEVSLEDVFDSLFALKRMPALVVFDVYDQKKCVEDLRILNDCLEKNRIFSDVGIYFRLDNSETGKEFNTMIANKQYNTQLSLGTKVVGVQSGKIPKFLLKNDWKPMSVVSIGSPLRHSKTAVYANCCDLVISYTDKEPIVETRSVWQ